MPSTDLRYFVVAVLIQRESGGNLTEMLANMSHLIRRAPEAARARSRVLSAEGRLSAWILGADAVCDWRPGSNIVNPEFMAPCGPIRWHCDRQDMLVLMAFGVLVLIKIVRIRV